MEGFPGEVPDGLRAGWGGVGGNRAKEEETVFQAAAIACAKARW